MKKLVILTALLQLTGIRADQPADLIPAVKNVDFDATFSALQQNPAQTIRDEALAVAKKIIEKKKNPIFLPLNFKGLAQTIIGAGLAVFCFYAVGQDIYTKREKMDTGGDILVGLCGLASYYLYRCGIQELALPYHRDYSKALAIESLLLKYQKPKQD